MTNEQIIKQLSELIDDRKAFCISDHEHDEIYIKDINALKAAIEFLKNDKPVKHGWWTDKPYERWKAYDVRYCSKCNWSIHKNHLRKTDLNWNFCPNCGARMDGDTNG